MPFVTYEARRGLAPTHVAGSNYSVALSLSDLQRPPGRDLKVMTETLAGNTETLYFGEVRKWAVTLAPMRVSEADIYYEFLRSTADGQVFAFDPYGSAEHNIQLLQVVRADSGFTEETFQREGRGGLTDWVRLGFEAREV